MIPKPGSDEAIEQGCKCPIEENNWGVRPEGEPFWISSDCKLHTKETNASENHEGWTDYDKN